MHEFRSGLSLGLVGVGASFAMTKDEQAAFLKSMGVSTAAIYNFLHNGGGLSISTTGKRVGVGSGGQKAGSSSAVGAAQFGLVGAELSNAKSMCKSGVCFGAWLGNNGKWNSLDWQGNGATGGHSVALYNTFSFRTVGRGLGVLSLAAEQADMYAAFNARNVLAITDSAIDSAAVLTGFSGPLGFTFSLSYAVADNTFGPALSSRVVDVMIYHDEATKENPVKVCTYDLGC